MARPRHPRGLIHGRGDQNAVDTGQHSFNGAGDHRGSTGAGATLVGVVVAPQSFGSGSIPSTELTITE